jgi:FlaA1/EpsC-like NDP-sugar epimerase
VHLVIQAACMTTGQDLFILEMGERVQILELAERMIQLHGLRPYIDIPIRFIGIRPGESLDEHLVAEDEQRRDTAHPSISEVSSRIGSPDTILDRANFLLNGNLEEAPQKVKSSLMEVAAKSKALSKEQPVVDHEIRSSN